MGTELEEALNSDDEEDGYLNDSELDAILDSAIEDIKLPGDR